MVKEQYRMHVGLLSAESFSLCKNPTVFDILSKSPQPAYSRSHWYYLHRVF